MTYSPPLPPQTEPPIPPWENLPTMYDLPSENQEEKGLPDDFHFLQTLLLYLTFQPINWHPKLVYSAADLNLYYDLQHPLWYKRPDWFGVVGVSKLYNNQDLRLSYVTWQEPANPFVVVELLSPGTEEEDLGTKASQTDKPPTKREVYERILRIPYYIVFSRYTNEVHAFQLVGGHYESVNFQDGSLPMPEIGLSLGLWEGTFRGIPKLWLRWFTLDGKLIPEPSEEANAAKTKAEKLAEKLRQLGINPDEIM